MGRLRHLRELDISPPVVAAKLQERYGDNIPQNEPVVRPADQSSDSDLITVCDDEVQVCLRR